MFKVDLVRGETKLRNSAHRFSDAGGVLVFDGFQVNRQGGKPCHRCRVVNTANQVACIHVVVKGQVPGKSWWCPDCVSVVFQPKSMERLASQPPHMTPPAVANFVNLSAQDLRDMVDSGELVGTKSEGGRYLIDRYELAAWMDENPRKVIPLAVA